MNFIKSKRRRVPSVIIVSLIDVLLVVLIFLMASTTFKKEPVLKLALPESKVAKPGTVDQKEAFTISVSTNFPFFYIGEKPVNFDQLQRELNAAVEKNPQLTLIIRADKASPTGEFLKAIDAGKIAKVASIDAITEKVRQ